MDTNIKANLYGGKGEIVKYWSEFYKEVQNNDPELYRKTVIWEMERNRLTNLINHARDCLSNLIGSSPQEKSPFPELIPQWERNLKLINKLGVESFLEHAEFKHLDLEWKTESKDV